MKITFSINYDLGLRGDYKGLYKWLDKNKAEERGNCYAVIKEYNFPDEEFANEIDPKSKDKIFFRFIQKDIKSFVNINQSDRIYLTFVGFGSDNLTGGFLFGKKHTAPWEGHFVESSEQELLLD